MESKKRIKILTPGLISVLGGIYGPILTPYMEKESVIFKLVADGVKVVEVLDDGKEVELSVSNFKNDNSADKKASKKAEKKAAPVVEEPVKVEEKVEASVEEEPVVTEDSVEETADEAPVVEETVAEETSKEDNNNQYNNYNKHNKNNKRR